MNNKQQIQKLRDNAELAWAAYGYYDLITNDTNQSFMVLKDEKGKDKMDSNGNPMTKQVNLIDIMDITHKDYKVYKPSRLPTLKPDELGTLKGDFAPTQAKRFFDKYDLLDFYPKFDTKNNKQIQGFHACLFQDKESKQYTLAIRGSFDSKDYVEADFWHLLINSTIPFDYYNDMLNFYEQCIEKYPNLKQSKSLNIVGHSLGGALAQMLTLSLCDDKNEANINEVYTFNSPGAKDLKPNIDLKLDGELYYVDFDIINSPNPAQMLFDKIMGDKTDMNIILRAIYEVGNAYYRTEKELLSALQIYFSNIPQNNRQPHQIFLYRYTSYQYRYNAIKYKAYKASSMFVKSYNTLKHNYENRNTYKLRVSDRVFHIESDDDSNPDNNQWQDELIQNLGIDIDGKHYYINIGIGLKGLEYVKVGKWFDSHSLIPLTQTLYFYAYLLELDSNNTMLESKLQSNNDKERLSEYLYTLNVFMKNIKTAMNILIYEIDKKNKEKYEKFKKQMKCYQSTPNYDSIDYLALFISQVNELAFKIETLKEDNKYFTSSIDIHTIIDTILKLQEHNYLIEIIDNDKLRAMRNQCKADTKASITEKLSLETCQPFRLVDKNNISYLNENNLHQIFGYKDLGHILSQEWHEEYINGRYKIAKGLYFGGNTISSLSKYAKDKELRIS